MTASRVVTKLELSLLTRLENARANSDALFALLPPNSYYERPIPERHRLIFYLGHLEAFDRNLLSAALGLGLEDSAFDKLFAFGIDPVGGGLPNDQPSEWPAIGQVEDITGRFARGWMSGCGMPSVTAGDWQRRGDWHFAASGD